MDMCGSDRTVWIRVRTILEKFGFFIGLTAKKKVLTEL